MEKRTKRVALIVAAGQGKRFGGAVSKQFVIVGDRPLLWYTLTAFERCAEIDGILVILPAGELGERTAEIAAWGLKILCRRGWG